MPRRTKGIKKSAISLRSDLESEDEVVPARRATRGDPQVHFPLEASSSAQLKGTQGSSARLSVAAKGKQKETGTHVVIHNQTPIQ